MLPDVVMAFATVVAEVAFVLVAASLIIFALCAGIAIADFCINNKRPPLR